MINFKRKKEERKSAINYHIFKLCANIHYWTFASPYTRQMLPSTPSCFGSCSSWQTMRALYVRIYHRVRSCHVSHNFNKKEVSVPCLMWEANRKLLDTSDVLF